MINGIGHPMVVEVHYLKQRPFTWSRMPFVWTVVPLTLFQTPLLTDRKARLASYSQMLVLNWTRKGQAGSRQRPCEGGAEAENRGGEDRSSQCIKKKHLALIHYFF